MSWRRRSATASMLLQWQGPCACVCVCVWGGGSQTRGRRQWAHYLENHPLLPHLRHSIVLNPGWGHSSRVRTRARIYGCVPEGARNRVETGGNWAETDRIMGDSHAGMISQALISGMHLVWPCEGVHCGQSWPSTTRMPHPAHKRMQHPTPRPPCSPQRTLFRPVFSSLHASPMRPPHHTMQMPRPIPTPFLRVPRTTLY